MRILTSTLVHRLIINIPKDWTLKVSVVSDNGFVGTPVVNPFGDGSNTDCWNNLMIILGDDDNQFE